MNKQDFHTAMNQSRNGCNSFIRHPLVRNFTYSDGVQDVAKTGCYWLVDVLATELPAVMKKHGETHGYVVVKIANTKAVISFEVEEGQPLWTKHIDYTDMPAGEYTFELADEDGRYILILITEH